MPSRKRKSAASLAAKKGWETRRKNERAAKRAATLLARKRRVAALQGWVTRLKNAAPKAKPRKPKETRAKARKAPAGLPPKKRGKRKGKSPPAKSVRGRVAQLERENWKQMVQIRMYEAAEEGRLHEIALMLADEYDVLVGEIYEAFGGS